MRPSIRTLATAVAALALSLSAHADAQSYCAGAPNSVGSGATIRWQGPFLPETGGLIAEGLPRYASGIFVYGRGADQTPFGNGFNCIGGARWILARKPATNGVSQIKIGAEGEAEDLRFINQNLGLPHYFQYLYRDPAAGGAGFNATNGVRVVFAFAGT